MLDAYAVIAFLRDEPAAGEVAALMRSDDLSLTAVGLGEVVDHLIRLAGVDEDDVFLDLAELGLHDALPIGAQAGAEAGRLRARYYHRTRCAVSMADCIAAAIAHDRAVPLATSDLHLLDLCHARLERGEVGPAELAAPDRPPKAANQRSLMPRHACLQAHRQQAPRQSTDPPKPVPSANTSEVLPGPAEKLDSHAPRPASSSAVRCSRGRQSGTRLAAPRTLTVLWPSTPS